MASNAPVTKIYELKTIGFADRHKEFTTLEKDLLAIKRAKLALSGKSSFTQDVGELKKYADEITKLKVEEQRLRTERQKMMNEQKAAQIQRQIDINLQKQKIASNNAEAGSISLIRKDIRELNAALILKKQDGGGFLDFRNETLSIDQARTKLKALISEDQAYRRQFQKDGTLVGEYTSGIVQAFQQMGLGDLVGGQVTKAKSRLGELNIEFDKLQNELRETKAAGTSTSTIEKQMIANRNEVIKLDTELARLNNDMRGTGDVGNQITTSISNGFKNLKNNIGQFVLAFVGAQAVISGVQRAFTDVVKLDSLDASMKAVSITTQELAINQKFLSDTTDRLGLDVLETGVAFKNFYAASTQAGLSADQAREIFTAAASASANLKLSQEQTNGVLLAFGQIASKGTVQAEELRGQIGERIPGAFSIAARAIGVTQQQLNKMLEQGEVLAGDFLPKFAKELQKTFGVDVTTKVVGLQANINRLKNEFTDLLSANQAGLSSLFSFLISSIGVLIKLLPLLVVAFALYTAETMRSYIVTQLATKGTILHSLALAAHEFRTKAVAFATKAATWQVTLFNGALKISPLGWFLAILGLVVPAIAAFANNARNAKDEMTALNQINKDASAIYIEQIAKLNSWISVLKSGTTSADTNRTAINELIKSNKLYGDALQGNYVILSKLEEAHKKVTDSIIAQARAQASATLTAQKQQQLVNLSVARQSVEIATSTGGQFQIDTKNTDLPDEVVEILKNTRGVRKMQQILGGQQLTVSQLSLKTVLEEFKKKEEFAAKEFNTFIELQNKADENLKKFFTDSAGDAAVFEVDILNLRKQIEGLDKELTDFQGSQTDLDKKIAERKQLQNRLDKLMGKENDTDKTKPNRASRLTPDQKDRFKEIEAERDELNAITERQRLENVINEETYLRQIFNHNVSAINKKKALLRDSNAEEKKQIGALNLEKVKEEVALNDKIFEIRLRAITEERDLAIDAAKEKVDIIKDNPFASPIDLAEAQLEADQKILDAQINFNKQVDLLEKDRNDVSEKNAKDRNSTALKQQLQVNAATRDLMLKAIESTKRVGENLQAEFELYIDNAIAVVQADTSLNQVQKNARIRILETERQFGILARQAAMYAQLEPQFKKALQAGIITLAQYEEIVAKLLELQGQLSESPQIKKGFFDFFELKFGGNLISSIEKAGKEFGKSLFPDDPEQGEGVGAAIGEAIGQSYSLAQEAMNSYFDAERDRIMENLDVQLERIEMEKQQVISRAQSQEEIASLEKQYEAKKKAEQKKAQEELKRSRRSEAKLALAAELANIWASVWSLGPVAGPIAGVVFSALALGRYALRVKEINNEKFEFGGKPGDEEFTKKGGKIKGKPHSRGGTPFTFKNKRYEAEAEELAIVRTRNAPKNKKYNITGNQMEIASMLNELGGGKAFQPGATLKYFETGGYLGQSLQAPIMPAISNTVVNDNGGITKDDLALIASQMVAMTEATNNRIDKITVHQETRTVNDALKKQVRQDSIGTL